MPMCDKFENWNHMTDANKLDALQDAMAHMSADYDLPMPEVVNGVPDFPQTPEDDSNKAAAYDPDTNTIYINDTLIHEGSAEDAIREAAHEFAHEMFHDAWEDENTQPGESEDYADAYTEELKDEIDDYCNEPPPPQSPGTPDDGPGDWNLPAEDMAHA